MSELSNSVYRYYLGNLQQLEFKDRFHFASRIYLWSGSAECRELINSYKAEFSMNNQPELAIKLGIERTKNKPDIGTKNTKEIRQPYMDKYPSLFLYISALINICFLKSIYSIDSSELFYSFFDKQEVDAVFKELYSDDKALSVLSTHAINFLYIYALLVLKDEALIDPNRFISVAKEQYDLTNPLHIQLKIYLYTHCIIADSLFYYRDIDQDKLEAYKIMAEELEQLIKENFNIVRLDNKFEFLVCKKILRLPTTQLDALIMAEAETSLSEEGHFLIDKRKKSHPTIGSSEHRNVLFIMANSEFKPLLI
jgi:hypothetical protein